MQIIVHDSNTTLLCNAATLFCFRLLLVDSWKEGKFVCRSPSKSNHDACPEKVPLESKGPCFVVLFDILGLFGFLEPHAASLQCQDESNTAPSNTRCIGRSGLISY